MEEQVLELAAQGMCCSQIVMKLVGLDPVEKENEDILKAMGGMSYGLGKQYTCGCLIGGVGALSMHIESQADCMKAAKMLGEWFEEKYGGVTCADILGEGCPPSTMCSQIMTDTTEKCFEILEEVL